MIWVTGPVASTFILGGGIMSLVTNNPVWAIGISVSVALALLWISIQSYRDAGDMQEDGKDEAFRKESEKLGDLDVLPGLWADEPRFETHRPVNIDPEMMDFRVYDEPQHGETRYIGPRADPHQHGEGI